MATNKDTIIKNYRRGLWTEDMLAKLVVKGKLSTSDFAEIVGEELDITTMSADAIRATLTAAVQEHMDKTAQERHYDDIFTAVSYVNSSDPVFAAEASALLLWRDQVWRLCYTMLDEVNAGTRPIPSVTELLAELPKFEWPEV